MKVVLLAAGMGKRLGNATEVLSKAMVSVCGKPLIDYALSNLLTSPKVEQVIVVGGFAYELLADHLSKNYSKQKKICLLNNTQYTLGNIFSALTAEPAIENHSFLLTNVDHIFPKAAWDFILNERKAPSIFCDYDRAFLEDEMKVFKDAQGKILMDKKLINFQAAYDGLTFIPAKDQQNYFAAAKAIVKKYGDGSVVEQIVNFLSEQGELFNIEKLDAYKWLEVDTQEDLAKAEKQLNQFKNNY